MSSRPRPTGMVAFVIVWLGQAISLLGTSMSGFGLTIWAYEVTGQATALALVGFFFITPMVVLSPGAGMGLMIAICGLLASLVGFGSYALPVVRDAEALLPDHDAAVAVPEAAVAA